MYLVFTECTADGNQLQITCQLLLVGNIIGTLALAQEAQALTGTACSEGLLVHNRLRLGTGG